ncbi:MAG: DUF4203 domain-containing protein [Pseudomonadota bacterium]
MTFLNLVAGILLLFAGRRLFWVSVACMGFLLAYRYCVEFQMPGPGWMTWAIPLGIGLIGALVALLFQKVAVVVIGFMIGEMLTMDLVYFLGMEAGKYSWVILLAGGLAGAIALVVLFDWALILLSSLVGATVIIPVLGLDQTGGELPFIILVILGVAVQTALFMNVRKRPPSGGTIHSK